MPYIKNKDRRELNDNRRAKNAGELNYVITNLLKIYIHVKGESYQTYNDIMGVLEGAKMELYRRKIAPYEDTKWDENGDVYSIGPWKGIDSGID